MSRDLETLATIGGWLLVIFAFAYFALHFTQSL